MPIMATDTLRGGHFNPRRHTDASGIHGGQTCVQQQVEMSQLGTTTIMVGNMKGSSTELHLPFVPPSDQGFKPPTSGAMD